MLGGAFAVLQAPMFDGLSFDPFALFDDGWRPAEVGVGRRHVAQRFVIALVGAVSLTATRLRLAQELQSSAGS